MSSIPMEKSFPQLSKNYHIKAKLKSSLIKNGSKEKKSKGVAQAIQ